VHRGANRWEAGSRPGPGGSGRDSHLTGYRGRTSRRTSRYTTSTARRSSAHPDRRLTELPAPGAETVGIRSSPSSARCTSCRSMRQRTPQTGGEKCWMSVSIGVMSSAEGCENLPRTVAAADDERPCLARLTRHDVEAGTPPRRWRERGQQLSPRARCSPVRRSPELNPICCWG
jgi:hypothetical protein